MPTAEVGEMANKEQLRTLQQGVSVWNQWREDHFNERVHLSDADLSRARLTGANLSRALLTGADLSQADLTGADLSRALLFTINLL